MAVNLSPARPGEESNGLEALHDALMKPEADAIVAVVIYHRTKRVFGDADTDDSDYPVVRASAIEPMYGADRDAALVMLETARGARSGKQALDLPATEDDAAFDAAAPVVEVAAKRKPKAGS